MFLASAVIFSALNQVVFKPKPRSFPNLNQVLTHNQTLTTGMTGQKTHESFSQSFWENNEKDRKLSEEDQTFWVIWESSGSIFIIYLD